MPRDIDVRLQQITCLANGFGGTVQVSGDLFGETFQNDPNNPGDARERLDIFPFPNGPIGIAQGQTVPITMNGVIFNLFAEGQEAPEDNAHFLKIGGALNLGLGSQFFVIRHNESLPRPIIGDPPPPPALFDLDYGSSNLKIRLTFNVFVSGIF
jgi:hypothetical protein